MRTGCLSAIFLLATIGAAYAAETQAIDDSPEVLPFIWSADAVCIFPIKSPLDPQRDDKHMRFLGPEAREGLVQILGKYENWWHGFYTIMTPENPPTNIGLLFSSGKDELVLFFNSDTVTGKFREIELSGMLEDKPKEEFEAWKRHYAQRELAFK